MRTSIKAALVAAATTTLLAPVGAAFAESAKITDGTGDTYTVTYDQSNTPTYTKSDVTANTDIVKAVVKHGSRISITATYDSLEKSGPDPTLAGIFKTDGDKYYMFGGAYKDDQGKWHTGGTVFDANAQAGRGATCKGFKVELDWANDQITTSAPRDCFGTPKYVIVHVEASSNTYDASTSEYTNYVDNAHNDKGNMKGWTDKIKKG